MIQTTLSIEIGTLDLLTMYGQSNTAEKLDKLKAQKKWDTTLDTLLNIGSSAGEVPDGGDMILVTDQHLGRPITMSLISQMTDHSTDNTGTSHQTISLLNGADLFKLILQDIICSVLLQMMVQDSGSTMIKL